MPDASQPSDAGIQSIDSGSRDAAVSGGAGRDASSARPTKDAGPVGGASADNDSVSAPNEDAGPTQPIDVNQMLGDTGLRVSDILGYYNSVWGDMVLQAHDDEIWGVYAKDTGTVVGKITEEGKFVGWWTQSPSRTGLDAGEVEFRWMLENGSAIMLDGRWNYSIGGGWDESWNLYRVFDKPAPSSLIDGFNHPENFKRHP